MQPTHIHVKHIYAGAAIHPACVWAHNPPMPHHRRHFLRQWRKLKPGRTLEQVAAELHISQPQLGRIERGDQPYNQNLLEALADLYGCTVADLLVRDPSDPNAIWSIWDTAKPGERRMIVAAAEAIIRTSDESKGVVNG